MPPTDQQFANLRLQIDALEKATKAANINDAVFAMQKTLKWSAVVIAVALIVSSLIRFFADGADARVELLEKRVQVLEKRPSV